MKRLKTFAAFAWKLVLGAAFCQFLPTSILVVGWTYRLMQRTALVLGHPGLIPERHEPRDHHLLVDETGVRADAVG